LVVVTTILPDSFGGFTLFPFPDNLFVDPAKAHA